MDEFLDVAKALTDANRVRALCALKGQELCVCQIIELLGLAPSTVSKHMTILRQAGLVQGRKEGRWMFYRLPGNRAPKRIKEALAWVFSSLSASSEIRDSARRLKRILKIPTEELCRTGRRT
jgi:ArsR family transcriptional regulator